MERERKDTRNDLLLADLMAQRTRLAQLLTSLLEVKRHREKQLMETLEKELAKRFAPNNDETAGSWLEEFQRLLSKESFEVQVRCYGIDARIADILLGLYRELDDEHEYAHGTMLQGKLGYYLGHFVDLSLTQLCGCSPNDLIQLHIDDLELCQLIVNKFARYRQLIEEGSTVDAAKLADTSSGLSAPSEEEETTEPIIEQLTQPLTEVSRDGGDKFWCEAECVICLDSTVSGRSFFIFQSLNVLMSSLITFIVKVVLYASGKR